MSYFAEGKIYLANAANFKDKIQELDLLRALAALSVIVIHITASPLVFGTKGSLYHYLVTIANQFARFSIPAFVFVSGLVLFYNYRSFQNTNWTIYFKKRVTFVLVPYFIWSIIYFALRNIFSHKELAASDTILQFLGSLFRGDGYYHLYFVVLIFQFYLIFPLIMPAWLRLRKHIGIFTVLICFFYFSYIYMLFYNIKPFQGPIISFLFQYQGKLFLTWFGFFALGAYCALRLDEVRHSLSRTKYPLLIATGLSLGLMVVEFYSRISNPNVDIAYAATSLRPVGLLFTGVAILAILAVGRNKIFIEGRLAKTVSAISNHSYGIYLIHPFILTFLEVVEAKAGLSCQWWVVSLNLLICFTISYMATVLLSSNKLTKYLVGR